MWIPCGPTKVSCKDGAGPWGPGLAFDDEHFVAAGDFVAAGQKTGA